MTQRTRPARNFVNSVRQLRLCRHLRRPRNRPGSAQVELRWRLVATGCVVDRGDDRHDDPDDSQHQAGSCHPAVGGESLLGLLTALDTKDDRQDACDVRTAEDAHDSQDERPGSHAVVGTAGGDATCGTDRRGWRRGWDSASGHCLSFLVEVTATGQLCGAVAAADGQRRGCGLVLTCNSANTHPASRGLCRPLQPADSRQRSG